MIRRLRLLAGDDRGATAVEFGFIVLPMCVLLVGGLDVVHQTYVRSVMQGALNDAARRAAVENPDIAAKGATLEERIENKIRDAAGPIAVDSTIAVKQQSYSNFRDIGKPEKIMTDTNKNGKYDAGDNDCFEDANENDQFDADGGTKGNGDASEVVFYTATVAMPRLFPLHAIAKTSPTINLTLQTAVRNQPYRDKPVPPVLCGV